jgi:hypothetical protein
MEKKNVGNIYKMPKKTIKQIKKDFEIKSKKDAINLFGLNPNATTKDVNKFLREQYKTLQKQINKNEGIIRKRKVKKIKVIQDFVRGLKQKRNQKRINEVKAKTNRFLRGDANDAKYGKLNQELLTILLNQLKNLKGRAVLQMGNKYITLTPDKIKNLLEVIDDFFLIEGYEYGSDYEKDILYTIIDSFEVELSKPKWLGKSDNNGSFFKYYHKTNIDLTEYGLYTHKPQHYKENCFIQSLISYGLDDKTIKEIRSMCVPNNCNKPSAKYVPTNILSKIGLQFGLYFRIKKMEYGETRKNKDTRNYGKPDGEEILLGLIDNHYFYIKDVPINMYAVKNYFEICDKEDYETIYNKRGDKDIRYTTSFKIIEHFINNKERYLIDIPFEDLIDTQYHNEANKITDLTYDEDLNLKTTQMKDESKNRVYYNIFFDFETIVEEKHIPYMVCIDYPDGTKTFTGEDCGKKMLNYIYFNITSLVPEGQEIKLLAHNAGYDFRFLQKYLVVMDCIERGHMTMNVRAKYFCGKKGINIMIQDTYSLITMPLSKFGKSFNLEVKKEILPYCLYTKDNVKKQFIPLQDTYKYCRNEVISKNLGKETTEQVIQEYIDEFIGNAKIWNCLTGSGKIDIVKYSMKYCQMDVNVLKQGYYKFCNMIKELGCDLEQYISSAQLSNEYMIRQGVFENVYKLNSTPREYIMKTMVGGRVMCCENKKQHIKGIIDDFDAVSLYPSAMYRLGGYLKGTPKILTEEKLNKTFLDTCDGYFIQIRINKVNIRRKFPLISYLNIEGLRIWTNDPKCNVYVGKIGLEDLIKFHDIEYEIVDGYYYDEGRNYNLRDCIENVFNERLKAKKEGNKIEQVYKLIMNSAYGKTLLKPFGDKSVYKNEKNLDDFIDKNYNMIKYYERVEAEGDFKKYKVKVECGIMKHFNNVSCGVEVLEMSKRIMNEVICLAEDTGIDIYYQDTDSMHLQYKDISVLEKEYRKMYNRELIGKGMGQFHSDFDSDKIKGEIHAEESIFLGKKCYIDKLFGFDENGNKVYDYHIRMKGVPSNSIKYKALAENRDLMDIYRSMLKGNPETFDLNCGGYKINFIYNSDYSISTNTGKYERTLSF